MRAEQHFPRFSVAYEREEIHTPSVFERQRVPDLDWRYVDNKGHGHFWSKGGKILPTLKKVVTGKGYFEDGSSYDIWHMECKLCGAEIEPGYKSVPIPPVLGPWRVTVTLDNETFTLNEEEYASSIVAWRDKLREIAPAGALTFGKT